MKQNQRTESVKNARKKVILHLLLLCVLASTFASCDTSKAKAEKCMDSFVSAIKAGSKEDASTYYPEYKKLVSFGATEVNLDEYERTVAKDSTNQKEDIFYVHYKKGNSKPITFKIVEKDQKWIIAESKGYFRPEYYNLLADWDEWDELFQNDLSFADVYHNYIRGHIQEYAEFVSLYKNYMAIDAKQGISVEEFARLSDDEMETKYPNLYKLCQLYPDFRRFYDYSVAFNEQDWKIKKTMDSTQGGEKYNLFSTKGGYTICFKGSELDFTQGLFDYMRFYNKNRIQSPFEYYKIENKTDKQRVAILTLMM